jgi:hypothetical protein
LGDEAALWHGHTMKRRFLTPISFAVAACFAAQGDRASAATTPHFRSAVLCVLVGKKDLKIHAAEVAVSSGDKNWDRKMRRDALGMRAPVPVAWTSDFWAPMSVADPGARPIVSSRADCEEFNRRLCGQPSCRQAEVK